MSLAATGQDIQILSEKGDDSSIKIYAKSNADFEQSVKLNLTYKGIKLSESVPIVKVLPPQTKLYFVTLTPVKGESYSYKYEYTYISGDVNGVHNDAHVYQLPFRKGTECLVGQSYLERPTHMNQYAVDFNMEIGTEICAARDGTVTRVVQHNNKGCPREDCSRYNNFILVKHSDGSVADYSHIKKNGAMVKVGDRVKAGQPIALSGDTGWASGPHLHFEVYVMRFEGQKSERIQFHLDEKTVGIPKTMEKYKQEL